MTLPTSAPPTTPLLEVRDIVKTFPGVRALDGVSFDLQPGEIHALVGENGAGKSTLMKVVSGVHAPDSGEIYFHGERVEISGTREAEELGICIIHQEFFLMPHLTVAQNIFIGREPKRAGGLILDERKLNDDAAELMERLGLDLNPRTPVGMLTVGAQQMVEIAKALSFDARVLIMDEPTAALTDREVDRLFQLIHDFQSPETGVVYISHRMEEIRKISDRITVLRDGSTVGTRDSASVTMPEIIRLMVGRELSGRPRRTSVATDEVVLSVDSLSTDVVSDVSFDLHRSEILGFAGLMGAGRTEVARALVGADKSTAEAVEINGKPVEISNPADSVRRGIGYLSEDRKKFGLLLPQSITWNVALPSLSQKSRVGWISDRELKEITERECTALAVKTPSFNQRVKNLSGGNQQKVVIAKWLARDCDILIFDEPTRGIDVGAKEEIYELLDSLVRAGKSIIVISSELEEVLRVSDRIIVMCNGKITGELDGDSATQEEIMNRATQFAVQTIQGEQ